MLRNAKEFLGYDIQTTDGQLGQAEDLLFDDHAWTVRYLLVDTGSFLPGRQVILSPVSLNTPDWRKRVLPVELTTSQIRNGPDIKDHLPVSRQHEQSLVDAYGWPAYWTGFTPPLSGLDGSPAAGAPTGRFARKGNDIRPTPSGDDSRLRSAKEVTGYSIFATDGRAGEVEDFIVETDSWTIHYLVVDTRPWWFGGHVIVAPAWFSEIDWENREIHVNLEVDAVKSAPPFNPAEPINREYEKQLYDYYGRPKVK